jgi:hypothetical protein
MTEKRVYTMPADVSHTQFNQMRDTEATEDLRTAIVSLALRDNDRAFVERACIDLSAHADEFVRGNAILGFGHIARRFRLLDRSCIPIIERGLDDTSEHVRGQAWAAADDVVFFLKWSIEGFDPGVTALPDEAEDNL